uniref:Immunoglobulin V-set domain-containing protein n=1 Tax=Neolamprologus brichardi TaxID=32507 RepID=A0A3Q4H756_NEOBR
TFTLALTRPHPALLSVSLSPPEYVAMLRSTLVSSDVFDFKTVPYNITWYNSVSGQEISSQTGHILVHEETLWILKVTMNDSGDYVTILRYEAQVEILEMNRTQY